MCNNSTETLLCIREYGRRNIFCRRKIRRDANEELKKFLKDKKISEDQCSVFEKNIQKLTDDFIKKIENILSEKEKEIIQI